MNDPLTIATIAVALVVAAIGAVTTIRSRRAGTVNVIAAAAAELVALVLSIAVIIDLIRGARVDGLATFIGYLAALILALPIAVVWAVGDETRWSGLVFAVAGVTVAVVVLRMQSLWLGLSG